MKNPSKKIEFNLRYSYITERNIATFWARLNLLCDVLIIFLGTAVFASFGINTALGALISFLGVFSVVAKPSDKANAAKRQASEYSALLARFDSLSKEDINQAIDKIAKDNSYEIGCLKSIAFNRACIVMGVTEPSRFAKYNFLNYVGGIFIGDLPKR